MLRSTGNNSMSLLLAEKQTALGFPTVTDNK